MSSHLLKRAWWAVVLATPAFLIQMPRPYAGRVVEDGSGAPLSGAFVTAKRLDGGVAITVLTDQNGRFTFPDLPGGSPTFTAHALGYDSTTFNSRQMGSTVVFALRRVADTAGWLPSAVHLRALPDGATKRKFILDCTGCHQLDRRTVWSGDRPKTREEWQARIEQMLSFAGAATQFPIINEHRDASSTAAWLVEHLNEEAPVPRDLVTSLSPDVSEVAGVVITEYDIPVPADLPHDLMLQSDGRVVITGMQTHQMYVLDPGTGTFEQIPIPVEFANPRALDIAPDGTWWVLLGFPQRLASYHPAVGEWRDYSIGMYPHSIKLAPDGRIWFNGHFTKDPPMLGSFEPASGTLETYAVPEDGLLPEEGAPIPYGLKMDGDGTVWSTELHGNRLIKFVPGTGVFETYVLPTTFSGPRRLDVAPDGVVWIPEYAGNKLAKFDPVGKRFVEYDFPVPDALPYVVRVDRNRGTVWIGTAAADVIAEFDPVAEHFVVYPLPSRHALMRHLEIDHETGTVWAATGDSPAAHPRIIRLEIHSTR